MGARPSTPRTVQLDNDIPIGVIDVSDDVVQRLKGLHAEARKRAREEAAENDVAPSSHANVPQAPAVVYYGEPTITSLEVRRQKEEELRNNDIYWAKRLQQQEENLKQTSLLLEKEYKNTIEEVRKRFEHNSAHIQVFACKDLKTKLIECYKANGSQTLNCSGVAAEFEECVQQQRCKILSEKAAGNKTACGCPKKAAAVAAPNPAPAAANPIKAAN